MHGARLGDNKLHNQKEQVEQKTFQHTRKVLKVKGSALKVMLIKTTRTNHNFVVTTLKAYVYIILFKLSSHKNKKEWPYSLWQTKSSLQMLWSSVCIE